MSFTHHLSKLIAWTCTYKKHIYLRNRVGDQHQVWSSTHPCWQWNALNDTSAYQHWSVSCTRCFFHNHNSIMCILWLYWIKIHLHKSLQLSTNHCLISTSTYSSIPSYTHTHNIIYTHLIGCKHKNCAIMLCSYAHTVTLPSLNQ